MWKIILMIFTQDRMLQDTQQFQPFAIIIFTKIKHKQMEGKKYIRKKNISPSGLGACNMHSSKRLT